MKSIPTILIVEDETLIRLAMTTLFEEAGFTVLEACSASSAMSLIDASAEDICILLTDIRLGSGLNGWDVARHARSKRDYMPVVFISGDSARDWEKQEIDRSVMLTKPVPDKTLLATVNDSLEAHCPQRAC